MTVILKLAWRNLWRNKRRTLISISSVAFGAFFCIIMVSFMEGTMGYMVDSIVEREVGHFQIMNKDYWQDRTVENFITVDSADLSTIRQDHRIKYVIPRAQTFSMAWNGTKTRPVVFSGINPESEIAVAKLDTRILQGSYLTSNDSGVIIGSKLAESMSLTIGDTLTLIGQGYQGSSAAGLFVIKGVFKAFDPLLDSKIVYTTLPTLQSYIGMEGGLSGIAVVLNKPEEMSSVIDNLNKTFSDREYNYVDWKELLKETAAGMASDKEQISIFFYVLYIIVGFGLLSTVIMMTNERMKEFGVMAALGTRSKTMIGSIFCEMTFIGLIGVIISSLMALPIVMWFHYSPPSIPVEEFGKMIAEFGLENYLPFALDLRIFTNQMLIVIIIAVLCTLYPVRKITKMKIIEALSKR